MRRISTQTAWGLSDNGVIQAVADGDRNSVAEVSMADDIIRVRIIRERDYRLLRNVARAADDWNNPKLIYLTSAKKLIDALDALNAKDSGR